MPEWSKGLVSGTSVRQHASVQIAPYPKFNVSFKTSNRKEKKKKKKKWKSIFIIIFIQSKKSPEQFLYFWFGDYFFFLFLNLLFLNLSNTVLYCCIFIIFFSCFLFGGALGNNVTNYSIIQMHIK